MSIITDAFIGVPTLGSGLMSEVNNAHYNQCNMFAELIDNAVDAGASKIWINLTSKDPVKSNSMAAIRDNGSGIKDLAVFFVKGRRFEASPGQRLGAYGAGAKTACAWLAWDSRDPSGTINVSSVSNGCRFAAHQNICHQISANTNVGYCNTPIENMFTTDLNGTTVQITGGERIRECCKRLGRLRQEFGGLYWPLIQSGKVEIILNGASIAPLKPNFLGQTVSGEFKFEHENNGLVYEVEFECGEVDTGTPTWDISCCGRIVNFRSRASSIGESLPPKFRGIIHLKSIKNKAGEIATFDNYKFDAKWPLMFNKDSLSDSMTLKIGSLVHQDPDVVSLISKLAQECRIFQIHSVQTGVNGYLQGLGTPLVAKRASPTRIYKGGKVPTGNGSVHRKAASAQVRAGGRIEGKGGRIVKIEYVRLGVDQPAFVADAMSCTLKCNTDYEEIEYVATYVTRVTAAKGIAFALLSAHAITLYRAFSRDDNFSDLPNQEMFDGIISDTLNIYRQFMEEQQSNMQEL